MSRPLHLPFSNSPWFRPDAWLTASLTLFLSYLLLRHPQIRETLLSLVPHRPPKSDWGILRQWQAPRMLLLGSLLALFGALILWLSQRNHPQKLRPTRPTPLPLRTLSVIQILLGPIVAANLLAANALHDQKGDPSLPPTQRILDQTLGAQLSETALLRDALAQPFPPTPIVLWPAEEFGDADDRFLFHALAYPIPVFPGPEFFWSPAQQREHLTLLRHHRKATLDLWRARGLGIWTPPAPQLP